MKTSHRPRRNNVHIRNLYLIGLTLLFLAACGTVAEPDEPFEPTNTALPRATTIAEESPPEDATQVQREATSVTPTLVPTVTPQPTATEEPTVAPTAIPTEVPTEEATEEPTEEASVEETPAEDVVMVNGIAGDAASGEFWFMDFPNQTTGQKCVTCHNPDEPVTGLGPYLYGIADSAGDRIEGYTAVEYLLESIVEPRAFLAPTQPNPSGETVEWNAELMPDDWALLLDEVALADLVAYLMTLHEDE
jgi:hypothetical protein